MKKQLRSVVRKTNSGCSVKLSPGSCLTDMQKTTWLVGAAIGAGAFGDIYLVSQNLDEPVSDQAEHVAKVESISSGPLFVEMNFYLRAGILDKIEKWRKDRKLAHLGMPHMTAFGNQSFGCDKFRFLVISRYGEDIGSLFNRFERKFSLKTVINIGLQIIDILEYIHYNGYVHADVKGPNMVLGFKSEDKNKVYLVDYGLAISFVEKSGVHKEYGQDRRRAHDGTLEYTSRDAHIGAHSRRGDLETLGYNLIEWLSGKLPWAAALHDPDEVAATKNVFMANIPLFMEKCFPHRGAPAVIQRYLEYVNSLKFTTEPDYKYLRSLLINGLKAAGLPNDGILEFGQVSQIRECDWRSQRRNSEDEPTTLQKSIPRVLRSLQVSERQTRMGHRNTRSRDNDWIKSIQSNPERDAKIHKRMNESLSMPVVRNVDPCLRQPQEKVGSNPTPQMMDVMAEWIFNFTLGQVTYNKAKLKILKEFIMGYPCKSQESLPSPRIRAKANTFQDRARICAVIQKYVRLNGVSAFARLGRKRRLKISADLRGWFLFYRDFTSTNVERRPPLNSGETASFANLASDDGDFATEDDEPLRRRPTVTNPIPDPVVTEIRNDSNKLPSRHGVKRVTMAPSPPIEERRRKRGRPRKIKPDHLRISPRGVRHSPSPSPRRTRGRREETAEPIGGNCPSPRPRRTRGRCEETAEPIERHSSSPSPRRTRGRRAKTAEPIRRHSPSPSPQRPRGRHGETAEPCGHRSRSPGKRPKSSRNLRSTPARRQRSVTPGDTFYTPYRGPGGREASIRRSPSLSKKRGRSGKTHEPRDHPIPRKRGRPRKRSPDHRRVSPRRERRSPTPRKRRGRPRKRPKSRERHSASPRKQSRRQEVSERRSNSPRRRCEPREECQSTSPRKRSRPQVVTERRSVSPRKGSRQQVVAERRSTSPRERSRPQLVAERRPASPRERSRPQLVAERRPTSPRERSRPQKMAERRPTSPRERSRPQIMAERRPTSPREQSRQRVVPERRPASPRRRGRERSIRFESRCPTPRRNTTRVSRSRSRCNETPRRYNRRRSDDSCCSSGSTTNRGSSPWRLRRRRSCHPVDYSTPRIRTSPQCNKRFRSRSISPLRYNRLERSPSRDRWLRPELSPLRPRTPTPLRTWSANGDRRSQSRFYARPSPHRF